jgi:hypothetical protein
MITAQTPEITRIRVTLSMFSPQLKAEVDVITFQQRCDITAFEKLRLSCFRDTLGRAQAALP